MYKEEMLQILRKGGLFGQKNAFFEERKEQLEMAEAVIESLWNNKVALIEAGTGVGKSFAYLLPALYYAVKEQKKVVISTYTVHLQEQLITKDVPILLELLGWKVDVSLVMGRSHYLCLKRVYEKPHLLQGKLAAYAQGAKKGTRSSLPFSFTTPEWGEVSIDADLCPGMKCPYYQNCFFFQEREKAKKSQIIILNHSLLAIDLLGQEPLFFPYEAVLMDEAHQFPEVVRGVMSQKASSIDLHQLFQKLFAEATGKVSLLQKKLLSSDREYRLLMEIKHTQDKLQLAFLDAIYVVNQLQQAKGSLRLCHVPKEKIDGLKRVWSPWLQSMRALVSSLKVAQEQIASLEKKECVLLLSDIDHLTKRLASWVEAASQTLLGEEQNNVKWIEWRRRASQLEMTLLTSPLDLAPVLQEKLFGPKSSVAMMSATLATHSHFSFLKERLGIERETVEKELISPFHWEKQALFLVPSDLPSLSSPNYKIESQALLVEALRVMRGRALLLFTSYSALLEVYEGIKPFLPSFTLLRQGEATKKHLLKEFMQARSPVLFGTDTFWEGVDLRGDVLHLVVVHKLPFPVPDHPITEGVADKIEREGKSPFFHYHLPQAVTKFKQGFGRLIRHREDRGVVLCLDPRLVAKGYGKMFLKSLPSCGQQILPKAEIPEKMKPFRAGYKKAG